MGKHKKKSKVNPSSPLF